MSTSAKCRACHTALPLVRSVLGKALVAPAVGALGIRNGSTLQEKLVYAGAGLVVGHIVDMIINDVFGDLCAECQVKSQPA